MARPHSLTRSAQATAEVAASQGRRLSRRDALKLGALGLATAAAALTRPLSSNSRTRRWKVASPVLANPPTGHRAVSLTFDQFRYGFASAISEDEAREIDERSHVPGSGVPLLQAAFANLNPHTELKAEKRGADRGHSLTIDNGCMRLPRSAWTHQALGHLTVPAPPPAYHRSEWTIVSSGWRAAGLKSVPRV
jgi:hypothetical protein